MDSAASRPVTLLAGRYELGRRLGLGGMGEVRAGRDRRLERPVAVKLLRPEMAAQASVRLRFESEARSAAQLIHPQVVAVFDSGEDDGVPFLVMELLSGETLADQIATGPASSHRVRRLGLQILAALEAAHRAGIVHRDVKPGNVLVAGPDVWKVGDFGIAKSLEMSAHDMTVTGLVMGTPAYLAPERLAGAPATPASDLYALGVVLYEALTGAKPMPVGALPAAILTAVPRPPEELRAGVHPALSAVIMRALAKDPGERFASAAEMAEALDRADGAGPDPPAAGLQSHGELATARPRVEQVAKVQPRVDPVTQVQARVEPVTPVQARVEPVTEAQRIDPATATAPVVAATRPGGWVAEPTIARPVDPSAPRSWRPAGAAALVLAAVVALSLALASGSHRRAPAAGPSTTSTAVAPLAPATGGTGDNGALPAPLQSALQRLEQTVRP